MMEENPLASPVHVPRPTRRQSDSYLHSGGGGTPRGSTPTRHHHHRHHHSHHHNHHRHHQGQTKSLHSPLSYVVPTEPTGAHGGTSDSGISSPAEVDEGLSWRYARQHIWTTVDSILAAKVASLPPLCDKILNALRLGPRYLILYCAIILIIAYSVVETREVHYVLLGLLVLNFAFNTGLEVVLSYSREREDIYRLYESLHAYRDAMAAPESFFSPLTSLGQPSMYQEGSPLVSIYPVYRDGRWQRVPMLLLVKGDLIALATGDVTPARVEPHVPGYATDLGGPISQLRGEMLEAGEKVRFRSSHSEPFTRKCSLSPSSRSLLLLCGDMRCFRVCETPIEAFLYEVLRPSPSQRPTQPLIAKHLQVINGLGIWAMLILITADVVIATFRLIVYSGEVKIWVWSILVQPVTLALLFLPLSSPALAFAAEAIATARLLTVLDKLQLVAATKAAAQHDAAASSPAADQDGSSPVAEYGPVGVDDAASEQSFEQLDADQRVNLRSKKAQQGRISAVRFGQYLSATLKARLLLPWMLPAYLTSEAAALAAAEASSRAGGGAVAHHVALPIREEDDEHQHEGDEQVGGRKAAGGGSSSRILPIPLARARIVERLGAVTMVTVVDDEMVCESSVPEELFLLKSKEEQSSTHDTPPSTILRTMHDAGQVHFEDPHWWQHLASLKPLGFACLACTRTTCDDRAGPATASSQGDDSLGSGDHLPHGRPHSADDLLVQYVSEVPPRRQYLADLGREIGFCDDDMATFRTLCRVHVLAPHLADEMAQEDTHALSVQETRHRGTLQPHITSVVVEDRRNGGLHLLSKGNPSLVLPICHDFWDGRVLNSLNVGDRHVILERHQQWVLEDFDVVALCYTPVPLYMHKIIRSRVASGTNGGQQHQQHQFDDATQQLPIYLVDNYTEAQQVAHLHSIREQANRERQARREALLEAAAAAILESDQAGQQQQQQGEQEGKEAAAERPPELEVPGSREEGEEEAALVSPIPRKSGAGSMWLADAAHSSVSEEGGGGAEEGGSERPVVVLEGVQVSLTTEDPHHTPTAANSRASPELSVASEPAPQPPSHQSSFKVPLSPWSRLTTPRTSSSTGTNTSSSSLLAAVQRAHSATISSLSPTVLARPQEADDATATLPPPARFPRRSKSGGSASGHDDDNAPHDGEGPEGPAAMEERLRAISARPRLVTTLSITDIMGRNTSSPCPSEPVRRAGGPRIRRASSMDNVHGMRAGTPLGSGSSLAATGDDVFWSLLQKQVFLGLVASNVLPKKDIPNLVEELMAAGVRFVYFSPRNMRRTKSLAEKMGIETGWNCAISLRPLASSDVPDEHRLVGEDIYGEWDVKARLPHGVEAIRKHLDTVDNVPLLVSLFTDATPHTIDDMFSIFHAHHESVLCLGYGFRATNARLFRRADLAVSLEGLPGLPSVSALPAHSHCGLSACDATFNEDVVSLACAFTLRHGSDDAWEQRQVSVGLLLDMIREGRRVLANLYQMVAQGLLLVFTAAAYMIMSRLVPIPQPGSLDGMDVLWLLWVVLPALALPLLDTQADAAILTRCPRKNVVKGVDVARALTYLLARCLPTVLTCIYIYVRGLGGLLSGLPECGGAVGADQDPRPFSEGQDWWVVLHCPATQRHPVHSKAVLLAVRQANDLVLAALVAMLAVQSAGVLYRTQPIWKELPTRNLAWLASCGCLLLVQLLHFLLRALHRGTLRHLRWVEWDTWVAMAAMPWAILLIGERVKGWDRKIFDRFMLLLKLEFNTRLGTHSPR